MHVDCYPIIEFERSVIWEFEVEFENSRIQLGSYTFTRAMREFDGALFSPSIVYQRKTFE
jgi:hypothetical protein